MNTKKQPKIYVAIGVSGKIAERLNCSYHYVRRSLCGKEKPSWLTVKIREMALEEFEGIIIK